MNLNPTDTLKTRFRTVNSHSTLLSPFGPTGTRFSLFTSKMITLFYNNVKNPRLEVIMNRPRSLV